MNNVGNMSDGNSGVKKKENGRSLFYAVIAIACFVIMAIGATFAYFAATTSSASGSVTTRSSTVSLDYLSYNGAWSKQDLIPTDTLIVEYSVENQNDITANDLCVDDYDNSICSIYEFQIINNANSPQNLNISISSETNEFSNLTAMAYEVGIENEQDYNKKGDDLVKKYSYTTLENGAKYKVLDEENGTILKKNQANDPTFKNSADDTTGQYTVTDAGGNAIYQDKGFTPVYVNRAGVKKTLLSYTVKNGENTSTLPSIDRHVEQSGMTKLADNVYVPGGGEKKTFIIVLYVKNLAANQTPEDAGKQFSGRVIVDSGDGSAGVSGVISAATTDNLQSQTGGTNGEEVSP